MKICKVCKKRTKKIAVLLCIYAHMGLLMQAYYKSAEINFQDYITLEADSHLSKYSAEKSMKAPHKCSVQSSYWPPETVEACRAHGIELL